VFDQANAQVTPNLDLPSLDSPQSNSGQNQPPPSLALDPQGFVATPVGVTNDILIALGRLSIFVGGLLSPMPSGDGDPNTNSNSAYVFHFTSAAAAESILTQGQINTSQTSGLAWVTPTPYASASLAQSQLALQNTPQGFLAIPVQNLQTPVSWSTVERNSYGPGGGVEGTSPVAIPVKGAYWVPLQ
jgi:hypothetical protein